MSSKRARAGKHQTFTYGPASSAESHVLDVPAKITLLYESKDRRLCLFEDANGHLSAVRSSRLA